MVVFPFGPNWDSSLYQTFDFKTDVLPHDDGTEQRRMLRQQPRMTYEYDLWERGRNAERLEHLIRGKNNQDVLMPEWQHWSLSNNAIGSGVSTLSLDTTYRNFRAGSYLIIQSNTTEYEYVLIESVTDEEIVTATPIVNSWSAGVRIYPAIVGRFPFTIPTQRKTSNTLMARVTFMENPGALAPSLPDVAATELYDDMEVFTGSPNWRSPISNEFTRELRSTDTGIGTISFFEKDTLSTIVRPMELLLKNKASIFNLYAFLRRRMGQAHPCRIPSWHKDFVVAASSGPTTAALTVAGTEAMILLGSDESQYRLRIRMKNGTTYYRRIVSLAVSGNNTLVGLDANFGTTIAPDDVLSVEWLMTCRLATDRVMIPWRTNTIATPTLNFMAVKA